MNYFWSVVFKRKIFLRIGQKLHKNTDNYIKNNDGTPILRNLVGFHPRDNHTKIKAKPCQRF